MPVSPVAGGWTTPAFSVAAVPLSGTCETVAASINNAANAPMLNLVMALPSILSFPLKRKTEGTGHRSREPVT